MGRKYTNQRLSTLAGRPAYHLDCEWIHKGVTTRVVRVFTIPAPWSVGRLLSSLSSSPDYSSLALSDADEQNTDWSL
jgi:hypothetical protein